MWPFRRPQPAPPSLTNQAYGQWLRAGRPDLRWFLGLSDVEREQLALLGDGYVRDVALAIGYAVANPGRADAGAAAASGDLEAEAGLAQSLAIEFARQLVQRDAFGPRGTRTDRPGSPNLAGMGEKGQERFEALGPRPGLFGRPPDGGTP